MSRSNDQSRFPPMQALLWDCARPEIRAELCVLASSSSGNSSVLIHGEGATRRATLIDCGISPLRSRVMLASLGLDISSLDEVIVTHFDCDHFHTGWVKALPKHARLCVHQRHASRATGIGVPRERLTLIKDRFDLRCGAVVTPALLSHDELGVAVFRIELGGSSLGYATDLGRVTRALVDLMAGVDVLAIESNYCPELQRASSRPDFLKRRIMDGSGHLSNEQCAEGTEMIAPRSHVVLLHLSRDCNTPERAARGHALAKYGLTVSSPDCPSPLIPIQGSTLGSSQRQAVIEKADSRLQST